MPPMSNATRKILSHPIAIRRLSSQRTIKHATITSSSSFIRRFGHMTHDTGNNNDIQTTMTIQNYNYPVRRRQFSSSSSSSSNDVKTTLYATVDHEDAYEEEIAGRHGQQLALAYDEGIGKDEKKYPFVPEDEWDNLDDYFADEANNDDDEDGVDDEEDDDDDYEIDDEESSFITIDKSAYPQTYRKDGSLARPPSQLAAFRAGAPSGGKFAVVLLAGTQHKVAIDDVIVNNKLLPLSKWSVGSVITLTGDDLLLLGSTERTYVGLPGVGGGAAVDVMVEEITKDKRIIVFKKRRRKNSKRKNRFRREVTLLRVLDIRLPGEGVKDEGLKSVVDDDGIEEEEEEEETEENKKEHTA